MTKTTKDGKKYFYRCNATTKRGKQCSTGLYILLPANNLTFEIYETECEHDHETKNVGVCLETREYIEIIFKLETKKPKAILTQIEN